MTGHSSVCTRGDWTGGRGVDMRCGSLFTACKEIWVQGYAALSALPELWLSSTGEAAVSPTWPTFCSAKLTWAADLAFYSWVGVYVSTAPVSVSVGRSHSFFCQEPQPPLTALCSLSSHWHQHKYYPNQRRKFFLNLDDKDIFVNLW